MKHNSIKLSSVCYNCLYSDRNMGKFIIKKTILGKNAKIWFVYCIKKHKYLSWNSKRLCYHKRV